MQMSRYHTIVDALVHRGTDPEERERPAFIFRDMHGGRHVQTFGAVYRHGASYAAVLHNAGLGRGQLVVNTLSNSPERVVVEAGILMAGATSINAQCLLADASDLLSIVRVSRAAALVVNPDGAIGAVNPCRVLEKKGLTLDDSGNVVSRQREGGGARGAGGRAEEEGGESFVLPHLKRVFFVRRRKNPGDRNNDYNATTAKEEEKQDFLTTMETSCDRFVADDVSPDDVCSVFTTSGSTGFSKLVVHTHKGLVGAGQGHRVSQGLTGKEVEFSMAPLGWMGGYAGKTFLMGNPRVLCDTRQGTPADVIGFLLTSAAEEKVDVLFVPAMRLGTMLQRVQQEKMDENTATDAGKGVNGSGKGAGKGSGKGVNGSGKGAGIDSGISMKEVVKTSGSPSSSTSSSSLKIFQRITLTGQPVTQSMVQAASQMARSVYVVYASTETFVMASLIVRHPAAYADFNNGTPVEGSQVKIVSVDDESKVLPANKSGKILFRSSIMMKEYLHDPAATAAAFTADGFFRTEDIGLVTPQGHVVVKGRGCDAIMHGPYIFYPEWLEERIRACPGVSDVMVVGTPDANGSEEIVACVTRKSDDVTMQQVRNFVEEDMVVTEDEEAMSPRPRHYLVFTSFPITSTGKPHRLVVRQQAAARLAPSSAV